MKRSSGKLPIPHCVNLQSKRRDPTPLWAPTRLPLIFLYLLTTSLRARGLRQVDARSSCWIRFLTLSPHLLNITVFCSVTWHIWLLYAFIPHLNRWTSWALCAKVCAHTDEIIVPNSVSHTSACCNRKNRLMMHCITHHAMSHHST